MFNLNVTGIFRYYQVYLYRFKGICSARLDFSDEMKRRQWRVAHCTHGVSAQHTRARAWQHIIIAHAGALSPCRTVPAKGCRTWTQNRVQLWLCSVRFGSNLLIDGDFLVVWEPTPTVFVGGRGWGFLNTSCIGIVGLGSQQKAIN